jgi:hypothetical protein
MTDLPDLRVELNPDGSVNLPALYRRLAAAEKALDLHGRGGSICGDDTLGKAACQAWMDWRQLTRPLALEVPEREIRTLADTRDATRKATLARIRAENTQQH